MKKIILCSLALLAACGDVGTAGLTPKTYSQPLVMTSTSLDADIAFARSPDEVTRWCILMGGPETKFQQYYTGCATAPNTRHNPSKRWIIYAVRPTSWNDHASLSNLGHEVAHALGASHE